MLTVVRYPHAVCTGSCVVGAYVGLARPEKGTGHVPTFNHSEIENLGVQDRFSSGAVDCLMGWRLFDLSFAQGGRGGENGLQIRMVGEEALQSPLLPGASSEWLQVCIYVCIYWPRKIIVGGLLELDDPEACSTWYGM